MSKDQFCHLYLACNNTVEADTIAKALLNARLIVCSKQTSVDSQYWTEDALAHGNEVLLMMESREDLFDEAEAVVQEHHSYETFVLEMLPVTRVSAKAATWMNKNLKK
jgi:uncharacterized protein involved in tolerance to divalent cations